MWPCVGLAVWQPSPTSLARVPIFAHLDLDAFFAAVEELENPELRERPLVVGGDPHSRGVVSTANYAAAEVRDPLCDECGRGTQALSDGRVRAPSPRALPPVFAGRVGHGRRDRPACRAHRNRRGLSRPRHRRRRTSRVLAQSPRRFRPAVRATTSLTCSLGVWTSKVVCKIASDRRKPGGITVVPPGPRLGSSPRSRCGCSQASARGRSSDCAVRVSGRSASSPPCRRPSLSALLPGSVGPMLRDRARGVDPRDLDLAGEQVSVSAEDTFARDVADRRRLHAEVDGWRTLVAERLRSSGLSGRTVTAKLRYGDFSIRTRSTTLVGRRRRSRRHRRPWPAACSTEGCATGPEPCGSSASESRASPPTASSRSRSRRVLEHARCS